MNTNTKCLKRPEWKAQLRQLKLEHIKATAPGFFEMSGGYSMKTFPYKDTTSNGLTRCIVDFITHSGGTANRINTQGQVRKEKIQLAFGNYRENITYTPSSTRRGTADIHAIVNGRHVSIEIKIGRDILSLHQLKERERITRAGGIYYVARDMVTFTDWYFKTFSNEPN